MGAITKVAVMTVEGANDDISAPGQCVAALALCTGLPASKKTQHLEPGAGHYGIFAGKSWRLNIRPLVLKFIDSHSGDAAPTKIEEAKTDNPKADKAPKAKAAS
jgi:poly(3-hydroxybutyrate) depolymerase